MHDHRPPFNRAEAISIYLLHSNELMRDYALPRGKARDALIRFFTHAFTRYLDRFYVYHTAVSRA